MFHPTNKRATFLQNILEIFQPDAFDAILCDVEGVNLRQGFALENAIELYAVDGHRERIHQLWCLGYIASMKVSIMHHFSA